MQMKEKEKLQDWVIVQRCKVNKLMPDGVYAAISNLEYKTGKAIKIRFHIGNDIAELLGFKKGSLINIQHKGDDPFIIRLTLGDKKNGFSLVQATGTDIYNVVFSWRHKDKIKISQKASPVSFDIFPDKSLVIDLSQFKVDL